MKINLPKIFLKSFTLAEMLVVITIIGIVATLTIPTLVNDNKDKVYSDLLSETYKKIETALIIDKIFDFNISEFNFSTIEKKYTSKEFAEILNQKLTTIEMCDEKSDCGFKNEKLKGYKLRLVNGSILLINDDNAGYKDSVDETNIIMSSTYIDVDGINGANKEGIDQFGFYNTQKGLIPMGGPQDNIQPFSNCLKEPNFACSAWILLNRNTDYKRCPNVLNWDSRTTCN